jgi:hypothetical protein
VGISLKRVTGIGSAAATTEDMLIYRLKKLAKAITLLGSSG